MSNEYVLLVHADDPKLLPMDPSVLSHLLRKGTRGALNTPFVNIPLDSMGDIEEVHEFNYDKAVSTLNASFVNIPLDSMGDIEEVREPNTVKVVPNLEDRLEDNNIIAMHVFDSYDVMVREASIMIASGYPTITVFLHGLSYLRGYLKLPRTQRGQHNISPSLVRHNLTDSSHFRSPLRGVEYAVATSVIDAAQELIVELESAC